MMGLRSTTTGISLDLLATRLLIIIIMLIGHVTCNYATPSCGFYYCQVLPLLILLILVLFLPSTTACEKETCQHPSHNGRTLLEVLCLLGGVYTRGNLKLPADINHIDSSLSETKYCTNTLAVCLFLLVFLVLGIASRICDKHTCSNGDPYYRITRNKEGLRK